MIVRKEVRKQGILVREQKKKFGNSVPKFGEKFGEKEKSSERILDLIKNKPSISAAEIAMEIDMSARGVEKQIRKLRETGIIKRIGADFGGYWEITTKEDK